MSTVSPGDPDRQHRPPLASVPGPVTEPATAHADRGAGRRPARDVDAVHEGVREHRRRLVGPFLLLLVLVGGDLVLIKSTFDHVLRLPDVFSWILACGVTLTSLALAWSAGRQLRAAEEAARPRSAARVLLVGLLLCWVALGLSLFLVRYHAASFTVADPTVDGFGAGGDVGPSEADRERMLAWLLLAAFAGSGMLAVLDGYRAATHESLQLRRLNDRQARLQRAVAVQEGLVHRLVETMALHQHELETVEAKQAVAVEGADRLVAELKQLAQVQLAHMLADPAATDLVHLSDPCQAPAPSGRQNDSRDDHPRDDHQQDDQQERGDQPGQVTT